MENNGKNSFGSFGGFDISNIEKDLGMILPESGDSGKKTEEKQSDEKKTSKVALPDMSSLIQIPETEEERKFLENKEKETGGEETVEIKEVESKKAVKESEENIEGEEDVIITEDSPLYLHAATLHEEGILPTLNLESLKGKKYAEALQTLLSEQKKYIDDGRSEYLNSLNPRQKEYLDLIEKGIPQEQVEHQFNIEESYGKITDEVLADDPELQKNLIIQNYKLKGVAEKKIQSFLKTAEDDERLFEEAKDAKEEINAYIANQKSIMVREAEIEERKADEKEKELQNKIKTTVDGLSEIFPGIKISANEKTELYDLMTKPVEVRNVNGQKVPVSIINKEREVDPINFNLKLIYYIKQGLFKKDFDLSKLNKKLTSSASTKLASRLKEETITPTGGVKVEKQKEKPGKLILPNFNT